MSISLLAASVIYLVTSIISWKMVQRRNISREKDGEVAKMRRLVSSFIHFLKSNEDKQSYQDLSVEAIKLSGTKSTDNKVSSKNSWSVCLKRFTVKILVSDYFNFNSHCRTKEVLSDS